jgi:hypothetical protein
MKHLLLIATCLLLSNFGNCQKKLTNKNATDEAKALYRFINDYKEQLILSGQQDAQLDGTTAYVKIVTDKYPVIRGFDFMTKSYNSREVENAIEWWNSGGIPTIMWHWGAPGKGEGYENSKKKIDIDNCFVANTEEYNAFWAELKEKGELLKKLQNSNTPILWRPFHELNGGWFWWSMEGPEKFKKLWITMYNYFTNELEINNLIWVLCYTSSPDSQWYPGDEYVDIIGADTYNNGDGPQLEMYNNLKKISNKEYPFAYHECGIPPQPEECITEDAIWSWWMEWSGNKWIKSIEHDYLKQLYNHDLIVTRDEMPNIMESYNWADTISPTEVKTMMKVDSGEWVNSNKIFYEQGGDSLHLRLDCNETGKWSWSGYGLKDTSISEQSVKITGLGTIKATFTNPLGAKTTKTFHIAESCSETNIIPFIFHKNTWYQTNTINIEKGQSVILGPQPLDEKGWQWIGIETNSNRREISVSPDSTESYTVKYSNSCGKVSTCVFNVLVNENTSSKKIKNEHIRIYPTPTKDKITIEAMEKINVVTIYTLDGKKVLEESFKENKIEVCLNDVNEDLYVLVVTTRKGNYKRKIIKSTP